MKKVKILGILRFLLFLPLFPIFLAATPQFGTMTFIGASRRSYSKDVYVSDVNAAQVNWDSGNGASATSDQEWRAPEPVTLVDFAIITGTADTEKLLVTRNGVPTGDALRYTLHLVTIALRPRMNIPFGMGEKISAIQSSD